MTRPPLVLMPALVSLALVASAEQAPMAVSPGHASKLALVEARCPTFSWGVAEGARNYVLVVYRLSEDGKGAQPVLRESLPGSASSWTPSLDRCLERGVQYAWSVRAEGGQDASEWSSPVLFEVAARPSEAEFEEAVAPATTQLSVDGNVHAQSFTGDGSHLSGVTTAVYDGGNMSIVLTATPDVMASVTVDQATSGRVILVSSATVSGDPGMGDAECSITTSDTAVDNNYLQKTQTLTDSHATIAGTRGYTINKGAPSVPPDTMIYNLVCAGPAANTLIRDANLTAIFVPDPDVYQKL